MTCQSCSCPLFQGAILKRTVPIFFDNYTWFTRFHKLWNVLLAIILYLQKDEDDSVQCNESWFLVDIPMSGIPALLPTVLMPLPGFPRQPSLSTLEWPLADLSPPQTHAHNERASPPFCRGVSLVQSLFSILSFRVDRNAREREGFVGLNIAPGPILCTCETPEALLAGR